MHKDAIDIAYEQLTAQCDKCKANDDIYQAHTHFLDAINDTNSVGYLCDECIRNHGLWVGRLIK